MPLVEIVQHRGAPTRRSLQAAIAFTRKLDKLPVPCRSAPASSSTACSCPTCTRRCSPRRKACRSRVIDEAAVDFGMPMGPIELADVVGLDVAAHVGEIIAAELGRPPPDLRSCSELVAAGKLGRKSGEGFYVWKDGKAVKPPAPRRRRRRRSHRPPDPRARQRVRRGVCAKASSRTPISIDAAVIFGTGFAPFRGGPLAYARSRGVDAVVARLEELAARYGSRFQPDSGWQRWSDGRHARKA